VRGIDSETGHAFDDTRRYVDALGIAPEHKQQVFEANARRVYPRLDALLRAQGR
jgi:4-oxalmesaconate hydratase